MDSNVCVPQCHSLVRVVPSPVRRSITLVILECFSPCSSIFNLEFEVRIILTSACSNNEAISLNCRKSKGMHDTDMEHDLQWLGWVFWEKGKGSSKPSLRMLTYLKENHLSRLSMTCIALICPPCLIYRH